MGLVFEHLEHRCEQGQLPAAWTTLLHTFERSILDTHRSKFTQYLLWYLCKQVRPPSYMSDVHLSQYRYVLHDVMVAQVVGDACLCVLWQRLSLKTGAGCSLLKFCNADTQEVLCRGRSSAAPPSWNCCCSG